MTTHGTTGRRGAVGRWLQRDVVIALLLAVAFVLVRLPFRTEFLVNWDAVNFALGIEAFDLGHHQPHAPGYIGYVLLGRLLATVTGDANAALTLLSVVAGGVLPASTYLLARRFLQQRYALLGAVLLGSSPVVWYYSAVALTYIVSAALTVPFVWAAVVARQERSSRHLLAAAGLLAALGAIRQTDLVLLLPVLLYAAAALPWRDRIRSVVLLAVGSLLWAVPLLLAAGGPAAYLERSRELAALAGGRTWALGANLIGLGQNVGLVGVGLMLGLNVGLLVVPVALARRVNGLGPFGRDGRRFLALWFAPALMVFLLIHTGQIGYVLLLLPASVLWVAGVAQEAATQPQRWSVRPGTWVAAGGSFALAVNTLAFLVVPNAGYEVLNGRSDASVGEFARSVVDDGGVAERTRQYVLDRNDQYWHDLVDFVETFDPDETVVLTTPAGGGSFRHLGYYLDEHRVYGLGKDRVGRYGHLFTARDKESDYSIGGLTRARQTLDLPDRVRWLVLADRQVQSRFFALEPDRRLEVDDGPDVVAVRVPHDAVISFEERAEGVTRIVVWEGARYRSAGPRPVTGDVAPDQDAMH